MDDEQGFAALSRRACPPLGEALFAVATAWRPVSWPALDAQLDQLALPLFEVAPEGRERAGALATLLTETFRRDGRRVEGLWLDEVLASRRGRALHRRPRRGAGDPPPRSPRRLRALDQSTPARPRTLLEGSNPRRRCCGSRA